MSRSPGVLNAPMSLGCFVTTKRPSSVKSGLKASSSGSPYSRPYGKARRSRGPSPRLRCCGTCCRRSSAWHCRTDDTYCSVPCRSRAPTRAGRTRDGGLVSRMEPVEGRIPADHGALEGGDGGHDVVDRGLASEDLLERLPILRHAPHDFDDDGVAVHGHLDGVRHRPLGLLLEARGAAVPELELVEDRFGPSGCLRPLLPADALCDLLAVGEPLPGSWQVAQETVPSFESRLSYRASAERRLLGSHGVVRRDQELPQVRRKAARERLRHFPGCREGDRGAGDANDHSHETSPGRRPFHEATIGEGAARRPDARASFRDRPGRAPLAHAHLPVLP